MNLFPRIAVIPLAVLSLAACSAGNVRPGSISTAIKAGQSWVVTRPAVAAQVLDTCSRPSPAHTGYWAPSRAQIDALEARLDALHPTIAAPAESGRQYVGIESAGRQLIYINAFRQSDNSQIDPAREAIRVCDGGEAFWGALYDPASGTFSDITHNGK